MKTRYIIAIAAAVMMFSGCQRELLPESDVNFGDGQIRYSVSNVGVKSSADDVSSTSSLSLVSGDGKLTVPVTCEVSEGIDLGNVSAETKGALINTSGEVISLPDGNKFTVSAYKGSEAQFTKQTATNSGDYWTMDPPQYWPLSTKLTFFAFANTSASSVAVNADATAQTLTYTVPSDAAAHQDILLGYYTGNGGNKGIAEIHFDHPLTAVMFKQGDMPGVTGIKSISLSGLASGGTVAMDADGKIGDWTVAGTEAYKTEATLSNGENPLAVDETTKLIGKDSDGKYNGAFLLVPQKLSEHKVTVTAVLTTASGDVTVSADITAGTWQVGKTNTYTLGYTGGEVDLLPGKFSISETEYVQFSRGNLQYQASTGKWRFAEHQYDIIGNAAGNTTSSGRDTQSNWIDLFGWGATGRTDINSYLAQPYENSTDYSKYKTKASAAADETLTRENGGDWGVCMGDNWRTLSTAEWQYLFGNSAERNGKYKLNVKVCGIGSCLIIVPDVLSGYTFDNSKTSYTAEEWAEAEAAGLVCLPPAGYRSNTAVNGASEFGDYWSSSTSSTANASREYFTTAVVKDDHYTFARNYGASVRLVQKFHDAVKIGGKYWATTNIGADTPKDYGWYFSWGNTTGYTHNGSNWVSAKDGSVLSGGFSDPNYNSTSGKGLSSDIPVSTTNDAARANWGGDWRMPTSAEFKALYDACLNGTYDTTTYASASCGKSTSFTKGIYWCGNYDGVPGILFCDNTNRLFFPVAGFGLDTSPTYAGSYGYYWSSSLDSSDPSLAFDLSFTNSNVFPQSHDIRYCGLPIRPVHD